MERRYAIGLVVGGSAVVIASLWLAWSAAPTPACDPGACPPGSRQPSFDAWQAFGFADIALLVLAVLAAAAVIVSRSALAGYGVALVGWLAAAGAIYAVGHPSHPASAGLIEPRPGIGFFVALAGSGALVVGGIAAART